MSIIKSSLLLLCRELKLFCGVDIKPENIRQAKFNQASNVNVEIFWLVLYRLCHKLVEKRSDAYGIESLESQVIFVKCCLSAWGYQRMKFYHLPANDVSGSRELLIALAWLLAKQNVFEKLISCKIWLFKEELKKCKNNEIAKSYYRETSKRIKFEDDLNKTMLLSGKLKHNLNKIFRLNQQRIHLLKKIQRSSEGLPYLDDLSLDEARIFFEESNGLIKSVRELQDMIKTHQKWEEKSCLFWQWMETVLMEATLNSSGSTSNPHYLSDFLRVLITRLNGKLTSTEKSSGFANTNVVPCFSTQRNKAVQLKILKKLLSAHLNCSKTALKEVKMALQGQIKAIVYNMTNTAIFI